MELSQQKAKDIDDILQFAVTHGFLKGFDVGYYQKKMRPDLEKSYLYHLAGLIDSYIKKHDRHWVILDGGHFACNNHTKEFLGSGGFQRIYEDELRQEKKDKIDLELAEKTLKTYKLTQILAWAGGLLGFVLGVLELLKIFKVIKY